MSAPKGKRAEKAVHKRFKTEEQQAIDALARWIGHPAVRGIITRHQAAAETAVMPIGRLLTDQIQVIRFCWHIYEMAGIQPGWELHKGNPWMLNADELNAMERVKADFRGIVQLAIDELENARVGLVPSWTGDHAVIGELLLLDIPWDLPPQELAADLQPPGIGVISADASSTSHRRGSGERANNSIGALRRAYERHLHGQPPPAPYAGGGTRALAEPTRRRRQALAEVLKRFPDATASRIFTTFGDYGLQRGGQARTAGGYLRHLLEQDAGPGDIVNCPPKSTLHADLNALRSASREQKQSG